MQNILVNFVKFIYCFLPLSWIPPQRIIQTYNTSLFLHNNKQLINATPLLRHIFSTMAKTLRCWPSFVQLVPYKIIRFAALASFCQCSVCGTERQRLRRQCMITYGRFYRLSLSVSVLKAPRAWKHRRYIFEYVWSVHSAQRRHV